MSIESSFMITQKWRYGKTDVAFENFSDPK